jgi:hypothetical protein
MSLLVGTTGVLHGLSGPRRLGVWLTATLFAVAGLAAAGCGGQAAVALPRKTALPAVPAVPASQQLSARQQVIAAYTGYWQALGEALDARNAARAQAILAPFAAPALIPSLVSGFQTDWARGEIQYGGPVLHILSVQITGSQAAVHDCADFSHAGAQDAATGQVVGSLGSPRVNMISTLTLTGGRWLLSNQVPVVATCDP